MPYGVYFDLLIRGVRVHDGRAERNHVHTFGEFPADDAAFQTGVASRHVRFFIKELFIEVDHFQQNGRFRIGRPTGIAAGLFYRATGQFEGRTDGIGHFHFRAVH